MTAPHQTSSSTVAPFENTSPLMAQLQAYLTCSELIGTKIPVETILKEIKELEWSSSLFMVAGPCGAYPSTEGSSPTDALEADKVPSFHNTRPPPNWLASGGPQRPGRRNADPTVISRTGSPFIWRP